MSNEQNKVEDKKADCLSCKLIRGLGCVCIGSYLLLQGKQVKSGYNRGSLFVFGGCFTLLGLANMFDVNPLNKAKLS